MLDTTDAGPHVTSAAGGIDGAISIGSLLAEADVFRIPRFYQRDLSWSTPQAQDLASDLIKALAAPGETPLSQLLGQIVLALAPPAAERGAATQHRVVDIVDGQQRMTTLVTLLCCLRDRIDDAPTRDRISALVVAGGAAAASGAGRIELRTGLADFYRSAILEAGATTTPVATDDLKQDFRNLAEIRQAFIEMLDAPEIASRERRRDLALLVLDHCYVARVLMRDARSAAETFIRINARGKSLLRTDRLKAHLVSKAPLDQQEALAARWDAVSERLDGDFDGEIENRKYLTSYLHDLYGSGGRIEASLRALIDTHGAERFLSEFLEPTARAYGDIIGRSFEGGKLSQDINIHLRFLSWLPRKTWITPALKVMVAHRRDPAQILEFLKALDRYAYGLAILGDTSRNDDRRYAEVNAALDAHPGSPENALKIDDADLKSIAHRLQLEIGGDNPKLARLVLLRAHLHTELRNEKKSRRMGIIMAGEEMLSAQSSVEHILPETPENDSNWAKLFNGEVAEHWKMIGNLFVVPADLGAKLGDKAWADKKTMLAAHIEEDGAILPFGNMIPLGWGGTWNKGALVGRHNKIGRCFKEMWGYPTA